MHRACFAVEQEHFLSTLTTRCTATAAFALGFNAQGAENPSEHGALEPAHHSHGSYRSHHSHHRRIVEDRELLGRQFDRLAFVRGRLAHQIEHERPATQQRRSAACMPAQQRAHTSHQFVEAEGLEHIVVRTGLETRDAVTHGVAGRHDQHAHRVAQRTQCREDRHAVLLGQTEVEDREVMTPLASESSAERPSVTQSTANPARASPRRTALPIMASSSMTRMRMVRRSLPGSGSSRALEGNA